MNNKLLFMVMNGEIKFLQGSSMDHKEWYESLGGNMDEYENVIRGFIMEGKIIFFKANLNYDDEVIRFASKTGLKIKQQLHDMDLKVCCGIDPGHDGSKWEPILVLNDEDLEGYKTEEEIVKEKEMEEKKKALEALKETNTQPIVEFKNDESDPKFIRLATFFTLIMMGFAFLSKVVMIHNKTLMTSNRWNSLLILVQFGGFVLSIVGYHKKMSKAKFFAIVAAGASVFMFDFIDIVIGILTVFFTMDHTTILRLLDLLKSLLKKLLGSHKTATNNPSSDTVQEIPTMSSPSTGVPVIEEPSTSAIENNNTNNPENKV